MGKVVRLPNARSPKEFADMVRAEGQDRVGGIFSTAVTVETAREELGPARWRKEFIEGELKWSKTSGYRYLKIADSDNLAEVPHVALPPDVATLEALARLTDEEFQKGLDTGIIHAGMERKDIKELKPPKEKPAPAPKPQSAIPPQDACVVEVRRRIFETIQELSPDELPALFDDIEAQIADLKAKTLGGPQ